MYDPITNSFRGFRGAGHEVTVAVLAEETVRVEKERAERASEAKSEFLATMSHELRTPLNAIIGFAEMIRSEVRGPIGAAAYRDYGQLIADSGRHLLALIDDVLDVGQAEAGRLKLQCGPVDLVEIASGAVAMLRNEAEKASLRLSLHSGAAPIVMSADARRLRQVLLNIIGNAIKFTQAGGTIDVTVERTASHQRQIVVRDTGVGIAEQDLPFVQQPFWQAEQSYTRRYPGVGLGLAICTQLVELHHGKLTIESEVGRGTAVTIQFPPPGSVEFVSGIAERIAL
jgi:signal transduction histidine kinase